LETFVNEREKNLGLIVGVVLAGAVGYWAFDTFYWQPRELSDKRLVAASKTYNDNRDLVAKDTAMQTDFVRMNLFDNAADSAGPVTARIYDLAEAARFTVTNFAGSAGTRSNSRSDIDEVRYTVTGTGGTPAIGKFLLSLQRVSRMQDATMLPIRIDEVSVTSRKEGNDDLQASITLTALIFNPKGPGGKPATKPAKAATTSAPGAPVRTSTTTQSGTTAPTTDEAIKNEIEKQMRERHLKEEADAASHAATQPAEPKPLDAPATNPTTQPEGGVR